MEENKINQTNGEKILSLTGDILYLQSKVKKLEEIIDAEEEIGIATGYLEDIKQANEATLHEKEKELNTLAAGITDAQVGKLVEGEQRLQFLKLLQEGNGEGCAKMAEDHIMDYLADLGCERALLDILSGRIRRAIRTSVAIHKYGVLKYIGKEEV